MEDFAGTGATFPTATNAAQFPVPKAALATTPEQIAAREAAIATFLKQLQVSQWMGGSSGTEEGGRKH